MVGRLGIEPRTYGLKARCSANWANNPQKSPPSTKLVKELLHSHVWGSAHSFSPVACVSRRTPLRRWTGDRLSRYIVDIDQNAIKPNVYRKPTHKKKSSIGYCCFASSSSTSLCSPSTLIASKASLLSSSALIIASCCSLTSSVEVTLWPRA